MKRFIFDVSISPRIAEALALLEDQYDITTVESRFGSRSVPDEDFLPQLAQDGGWVVITQDRGRKAGNWHVWRASGVTVVFLKKGWMNKPNKAKAAELIRRWDEIVRQVNRHPEGTCFWLSTRGRVEPIR